MSECPCPDDKLYCKDHPIRADTCWVCFVAVCIECGKQHKAKYIVNSLETGETETVIEEYDEDNENE